MSALATLRSLAAGGRPVDGLLHTARLEAGGGEAYGEEAIVERFRRAPFDVSAAAKIVEVPGHLAIFDGNTALVADLAGQAIARLWRLGDADLVAGEHGVSVVFDPDLTQTRGDVFARASDHPALAHGAIDQVLLAGRAIARDDAASYRTRAFAVRAFGTAGEGVALFAVHRLVGESVRTAGFAMTAARWTAHGLQIVSDRAGRAAVGRAPGTPAILA